jgi:predicted permease
MIASALLLLPDFLLIALGALLRRLPVFDPPFWRGLERLVYFVLFPALLFRALASSALSPANASRLIAVGVLFTLAGMLLTLVARPLLRLPAPTFAACFQCAFRFNTYISLAAASRLGGVEGVAAMSLLVGVLVPLVNIAAVAMLARERGRGIWLAIVRNPLVLACAGGLLWNALRLPLPPVVATLLELLAAAALPLGLIAAGAGLAFVRGTLSPRALVWWNGVKLGALPAIALVLATLFGLSTLERQIAVLLAAAPTAPSAACSICASPARGRPAITSATP